MNIILHVNMKKYTENLKMRFTTIIYNWRAPPQRQTVQFLPYISKKVFKRQHHT